jgi:hypothetical protein
MEARTQKKLVPAAVAPRTWVSFLISPDASGTPFFGVLTDGGMTKYKVEKVEAVRGRPLAVGPGWQVTRLESRTQIARPPTGLALTGVSQHLEYTSAREREKLEGISRREAGNIAVLIPIVKSEAWWAMAQDERQAYFRRAPEGAEGHVEIGKTFAASVLRRLYHARYLPGAEWDFLTYFEFGREQEGEFRQLLAGLRDPARNPEWQFVERETEIWLNKTR